MLEFTGAFATSEECDDYLCRSKWGKGFRCRSGAHETAVKGRTRHYRKCQQ